MKIVHIAPASVYNEGWGYQENLLTKYQAKQGHDVTLIVANQMFDNGKVTKCDECDYFSTDGFRVIRKKYKRIFTKRVTNTCSLMNVYSLLESLQPDLIHFHCLVSVTLNQVGKYVKKHKNCRLIIDNHLDFNIGYKPKTKLKDRIIVLFFKRIFKKNQKQVSKVYGVTPWRKTYAEQVFGVPKNKTDVLIMGADDEALHFESKPQIRLSLRKEYGISDDTFLIVTGGKIDSKKNIHLLVESIKNIDQVKLLIFGNCLDDFQNTFQQSLNEKCVYIGWIDSKKVYDYFFAADLIVFPGQHSVLWEQACASKTPCMFKYFDGMDHVNNGGNSVLVKYSTASELGNEIRKYVFTDDYYELKKNAESNKTDVFLYSEIAKKSTII